MVSEAYSDQTSYFVFVGADPDTAPSLFGLLASFSQYSLIGSSNMYFPLIIPKTDPNNMLPTLDAPDLLNDGLVDAE